VLLDHGAFSEANSVFEFGLGTGRFAVALLARHLPPDARYRGVDLSPTMVRLAHERLHRFGARAEVVLIDEAPPLAEQAETYDRFVSNFVLDLLSEQDISLLLHEAHRVLRPGGLLCVASLSEGVALLPRLVARVWSIVHTARPALVGGCRPLNLLDWLAAPRWRVRHHVHLAPFGLPCESVIAQRT
jgi:ubiquinone/menaquinone biosynthesis C-methylase UbiE